MKKMTLHTQIASLPDRENVVFELWADDKYVAEVTHEPGQPLLIDFYDPSHQHQFRFDLKEFVEVLEMAVKNLSAL